MSEETYTITFTASQIHTLINACDDSEDVTNAKLETFAGDYDEEETEAMREHIQECDMLSSALLCVLIHEPCSQAC